MSRELNKIFDVQSREARRDILDKFELTAEDKNKILNKINSGSGSGSGETSNIKYYHIIKDYIGTDSEYGDDVCVSWFITDHVKAFEISTEKYLNVNVSFLDRIDSNGIRYKVTDIMFVCGHYAVRDNIDDNSYIEYYDSYEEYLKQCVKQYGLTINPSDHVKPISYDEYWEGMNLPTDNVPI